MAQDSWGERVTRAIAGQIRRWRHERGLSTERLADECARLGMPVPRSVLANLENGRRESVTVAELAVIAAALGVAPALLLFPIGLADSAEYLPGRSALPWDAARWWAGEASLEPDGTISPTWRRSVATMFRDHDRLLSELGDGITESAYAMARRLQFRGQAGSEERVAMLTATALADTRLAIREVGLMPPPLPPALAWLDEEAT